MINLINQFCISSRKRDFLKLNLETRKLFVFCSIKCIDENVGNIILARKILSFFDQDENIDPNKDEKKIINELDEEEVKDSKSLILIFKDLKSYKIDEHSYFRSNLLQRLLELSNNGYILLEFDSVEFERVILPEKFDETYLLNIITSGTKNIQDIERNIQEILNFLDYFAIEKEKMVDFSNIIIKLMKKLYSKDVEKYLIKHIKIKEDSKTDDILLSNPNISEKFCLKNAVDFSQVAQNYGLPESFFRKNIDKFTASDRALYFLCKNKALSEEFFIDNKGVFNKRCKLKKGYVGVDMETRAQSKLFLKFTDIILLNPNISENYLRNFIETENSLHAWFYISKNHNLSEQFIREFIDSINIRVLINEGHCITHSIFNLLLPQITAAPNINLLTILEFGKITEAFFTEHRDLFFTNGVANCYKAMAKNKNLSVEHLNSSIELFMIHAGEEVCLNRYIPLQFFEGKFNELNLNQKFALSRNPVITDEFATAHFDDLIVRNLLLNPNLSEDFFEKYKSYFSPGYDQKRYIEHIVFASYNGADNIREFGLPLKMFEEYINYPEVSNKNFVKWWRLLDVSIFRLNFVGLDYLKNKKLSRRLKYYI